MKNEKRLTIAEQKSLEQIWEGIESLKNDFENHRLTAELNLTQIYINMFTTLATISIAIIGLGFSSKIIKLDIFTIIALLFSIILIILSVTYTRELIDFKFRELKTTSDFFRKEHKKVTDKLLEVKNKCDYSIIEKYMEQRGQNFKKTKGIPNYFGEIGVFLFIMIMLLIIVSFISNMIIFNKYIIIFIILIISILLGFKDWSLSFNRSIDKIVHIFFKKEVE